MDIIRLELGVGLFFQTSTYLLLNSFKLIPEAFTYLEILTKRIKLPKNLP